MAVFVLVVVDRQAVCIIYNYCSPSLVCQCWSSFSLYFKCFVCCLCALPPTVQQAMEDKAVKFSLNNGDSVDGGDVEVCSTI